MRIRLLVGFTLLLCLVVAVPSVWAQTQTTTNTSAQTQMRTDEKDRFRDYLAPYLGMDTGGTLFQSASPLGGLNQGTPKVYGIAVGFWGKGMLSGELDFAYHPSFFGAENSTIFVGNQMGSNSLMTITASFVINPSIDIGSQRIRPYFLVGGGLMRSTVNGFTNLGGNANNRGIVDLGGGIQYYPVKRVGFRVDLRYNIGVGANDSTQGWGWMDKWNFFRFVIGPAFTF